MSKPPVHAKIFANHPPWGKLWDILCGFEAWNGALMTEDRDGVTCDKCIDKIKKMTKKTGA